MIFTDIDFTLFTLGKVISLKVAKFMFSIMSSVIVVVAYHRNIKLTK